MATVDPRALSKGADEPHRMSSVWSAFDTEQRRQLIDDDLLAGRSVSLVLISVVTAGFLMMILTVLAAL
jgi:hypothetical protein